MLRLTDDDLFNARTEYLERLARSLDCLPTRGEFESDAWYHTRLVRSIQRAEKQLQRGAA